MTGAVPTRTRIFEAPQKAFQTKGPNRANSNRPPTPQTQKRKLAVKFGELISFFVHRCSFK
jgi:hypothetical protein